MRTVVAILLTMAQVGGPWLCCCGPLRALTAKPVAAAPVSDVVEACEHCCKSKPKSTQSPEKSKPIAPLPGDCPHCVKLLDSVAPNAGDRLAEVETSAIPFAFVLNAAVPLPVSSVAPTGLSELPFLPTQARLHVHHVLRC